MCKLNFLGDFYECEILSYEVEIMWNFYWLLYRCENCLTSRNISNVSRKIGCHVYEQLNHLRHKYRLSTLDYLSLLLHIIRSRILFPDYCEQKFFTFTLDVWSFDHHVDYGCVRENIFFFSFFFIIFPISVRHDD